MKKKVLFMIDSLACGGAERSLINLLHHLDYDKIDVQLLMVTQGRVYDSQIPKQVTVIDYRPAGTSLLRKVWCFICRLCYSLAIRINDLRKHPIANSTIEWRVYKSAIQPLDGHYDVAIAYQQGFPAWYVAEKVSADKKIAWINNDYTQANFKDMCVKSLYDKYDDVVAVSGALYDIILQDKLVDVSRLHCIYDIIDTDSIIKQSHETVEGFEPVADVPTIVTVGRLEMHQKGQDLCIEASAILKQRGVKHQWYFVGDGPHRDTLKAMAVKRGVQDNVHFVGMTLNPYPYMRMSDVYVQSSRYEGFGLTITEAKLIGCTIICTDFPSAHHQIDSEVNGLIVPISAVSIADAIQRILTDTALCHRLREAVKTYVNTTPTTVPEMVMKLI